jgi:hypothetical protein
MLFYGRMVRERTMASEYEKGYEEGRRSAYRFMLRQCLSALGYESVDPSAWVLEREETVAKLREICEDHGDNEWENDLHLADVIDKHLYFA